MTKSIRTILMPFLMVGYVFGLRITNLSNHSRLWFSVIYILLLWSIYYYVSLSTLTISFDKSYPIEDNICMLLENCTTLWTIVFGIYHNKKFQNCLKKLDIVDNTLLKLGIITDYDKLRNKAIWFVLGWFVIVMLTNCGTALYINDEYNWKIPKAMFFIFMRNYCFHLNFIGDLTTASILEYTGLKFDQVNEHLQNLLKNNKHELERAWENPMMYLNQHRFSEPLNSKCILWTIIHLHLDLRKISCEIDSIFGTQMTIKMASYFGWIAIDLREILYAILNKTYVQSKIMKVTMHLLWFSHNVFKFLLINYTCETVTTKASATADLLNRLSYCTGNVEIRKIISQFSLQIVHAPLRFCGIGFFQFGFKFLHRFIASIATVLVIIIQGQANVNFTARSYGRIREND